MTAPNKNEGLIARLNARVPTTSGGALANPDGPEAARAIQDLEGALKAAEGRAEDYRTVAINQGWNWSMCDSYGREAYLVHRGEHVDACALNAAEERARKALASTADGGALRPSASVPAGAVIQGEANRQERRE